MGKTESWWFHVKTWLYFNYLGLGVELRPGLQYFLIQGPSSEAAMWYWSGGGRRRRTGQPFYCLKLEFITRALERQENLHFYSVLTVCLLGTPELLMGAIIKAVAFIKMSQLTFEINMYVYAYIFMHMQLSLFYHGLKMWKFHCWQQCLNIYHLKWYLW